MTETNELLRADLRRDTELVADNIEVTKFPQMVHVTVDNMRKLIADADRLQGAEELLRETSGYLSATKDAEGPLKTRIDAFLGES